MLLLLSSTSIVFPILMGIKYWRKIDIHQKTFLKFIVFSAFVEIAAIVTSLSGIENIFIFKIFLLCDFLFFYWFLTKILKYSKWFKVFSLVVVMAFGLWPFIENIVKRALNFDTYFFSLIFFYFVIQSGLVLLQLAEKEEESPLKNYFFWIGTARFLYYLVIIFIYVSPVFIKFDHGEKISILSTTINGFGNILCNILYGLSFYARK